MPEVRDVGERWDAESIDRNEAVAKAALPGHIATRSWSEISGPARDTLKGIISSVPDKSQIIEPEPGPVPEPEPEPEPEPVEEAEAEAEPEEQKAPSAGAGEVEDEPEPEGEPVSAPDDSTTEED